MCRDAIGTSANGINERGEIVGSFTDGSGSHGFVKFKKKFRSIDFPGALFTVANGINKRGQIVGSYADSQTNHGFLRSGNKFSTIDFPGASSTVANAIDIGGQIVGAHGATAGFPFPSLITNGFLDDDNVFTNINFTANPFAQFTVANGINSGRIVGSFFVHAPGPILGFVIPDADSLFSFESFSFPGSLETFANGINSAEQIVGFYSDSSSVQHGFLAIPQ